MQLPLLLGQGSGWLLLCATFPGGTASFPWALPAGPETQLLQQKVLRERWQWALVLEALLLVVMCEFPSSDRLAKVTEWTEEVDAHLPCQGS